MGLHGMARRLGTRFFSSSMPRADGPSKLRIAVIGAGPGGLAMAHQLLELGQERA